MPDDDATRDSAELKKKKRTRPPVSPTARLLAAKPAHAYLGVPYSSLRDIVHRGELPTIRVGRAMYFDRRDLDTWVEARKERS